MNKHRFRIQWSVIAMVGMFLPGTPDAGAQVPADRDEDLTASAHEIEQNIMVPLTVSWDNQLRLMHFNVAGQRYEAATWPDLEMMAMRLHPGRAIQYLDAGHRVLRVSPRVMMGVWIEPVTGALASQLRLGDGAALLVTEVREGLPAAKAGLRAHDVILEIGGLRPVTQPQFAKMVSGSEPGDLVNVVIRRGGVERECNVRLSAYDPLKMAPASAAGATGIPAGFSLPSEAELTAADPDRWTPVTFENENILSLLRTPRSLRDPLQRNGSLLVQEDLQEIMERLDRIEDILARLVQMEMQRGETKAGSTPN